MADELVIQGKTVKMTFGRLNYLATRVNDISEIDMILISPKVQEKIIRGVLATYKKEGDSSFYDSEDLLVDIDSLESSDAIRILEFAEEHLHNFFMEAMSKFEEKAKLRANENSSPNS